MRDAIQSKLSGFLENFQGLFSHEYEAVYLMVEIRKLLDHQRDIDGLDKYPLIRFYCDWIVHVRKDRSKPIADLMKRLDDYFPLDLKDWPDKRSQSLPPFLTMDLLRTEMESVFKENNLPLVLCEDDPRWIRFLILMVAVLVDQPIVDIEGCNISKFSFKPQNEGELDAVRCEIEFKDARGILEFYYLLRNQPLRSPK